MKTNKDDILLAILNITSWTGYDDDATHVYGTLILCANDKVNIDNIEDYNVKYLGENIELYQPLTLDLAKKLDAKDGHCLYQHAFRHLASEPVDSSKSGEYYSGTNRFDTFDEVEKFAIAEWKKLDLKCPFISLYEGEKYDFTDRTSGEKCVTKILYPD